MGKAANMAFDRNLVLVGDSCDLVGVALEHTAAEMGVGLNVVKAANFDSVLDCLSEISDISLCLIDVDLQGFRGSSDIDRIKEYDRDILVAIMSNPESGINVRPAVEADAAGWILKSMKTQAIVCAMQLMLSGERFWPEELFANPERHWAESYNLTQREQDILKGISEGLPNKLIAHKLGIKEVTVRVHASKLYRKLGVHTRTQAALLADKMGHSDKFVFNAGRSAA